MAKGQGKFGKFISYILILMIVIGAIGFLAYFTNGFTEDIKTFSVECNGKHITTSASGFSTTMKNPLEVKVKYTLSSKETSGYSLKIVPNAIAGKDFDFKLDDDVYSFQSETDLTDGFEVEYKEDSFIFKPKGGLTEILQAVYPNNVVEDCRRYSYENMFTLIVTSYDGSQSVYLHFSVPEIPTGVTLSQEVIVF
jgi:hypothetical protein